MKICIITGLAGPGSLAGGVWRVADMQARALAAAGHDVRLLTGWLSPEPPPWLAGRPEITMLRLRRPVPGSGLRLLWPSGLRRAVADAAQWAEIAHVHLCRDLITTPATAQLLRAGVPVIAQSHGMLGPKASLSFRMFDRLTIKRIIPGLHRLLSLTEPERQSLLALGISARRILEVSNATEAPLSTWSDPDEPLFVFASRLHARKQPAVFVRAALNLLDNGNRATFVIAGPDQGEGQALKDLIARSAHAASFRFLGSLEHGDLMGLLTRTTAMVLPSISEPYPMIVLEACARGVPSIVTRDVGIAALLQEHDAAELVDPHDSAVAEAMTALLFDRSRRAKLSSNAQSLYEAQWRPDTLAALLSGYYLDAVSQPTTSHSSDPHESSVRFG
jgi:glycosyltransferase involved in cell wall biosynthesis